MFCFLSMLLFLSLVWRTAAISVSIQGPVTVGQPTTISWEGTIDEIGSGFRLRQRKADSDIGTFISASLGDPTGSLPTTFNDTGTFLVEAVILDVTNLLDIPPIAVGVSDTFVVQEPPAADGGTAGVGSGNSDNVDGKLGNSETSVTPSPSGTISSSNPGPSLSSSNFQLSQSVGGSSALSTQHITAIPFLPSSVATPDQSGTTSASGFRSQAAINTATVLLTQSDSTSTDLSAPTEAASAGSSGALPASRISIIVGSIAGAISLVALAFFVRRRLRSSPRHSDAVQPYVFRPRRHGSWTSSWGASRALARNDVEASLSTYTEDLGPEQKVPLRVDTSMTFLPPAPPFDPTTTSQDMQSPVSTNAALSYIGHSSPYPSHSSFARQSEVEDLDEARHEISSLQLALDSSNHQSASEISHLRMEILRLRRQLDDEWVMGLEEPLPLYVASPSRNRSQRMGA